MTTPTAAPTVVADLRSDTLTCPTDAMRAAISAAPVGDDLFGEDPTVLRLEARVAELLGKEAAVYCTSGSLCNQLAIAAQAQTGDEILLHERAHPVEHEGGAPAALAGVSLQLLPGPRGIITPETIRAAIRPDATYYARSRLLFLEQTHNMCGGTIWPAEALDAAARAGREGGLSVHLDGARLWNACAATGLEPARYTREVDTVSVCFSKGLGAPVGSVLAGPADVIWRARRARQRMGAGWRQAGLLAAGALHALDHHRERLVDDHANARRLADGLRDHAGLVLPPAEEIETNILFIDLADHMPDAPELQRRLDERGVRVFALDRRALRAVTHMGVGRDAVERAIDVFRNVAASC